MTAATACCRVVLCDDAPDFLALLSEVIDLEPGMDVVGRAKNGEEAIRTCADLKPDLCALDVSMPVMDGLTALPQIREVSPETTVVMLSGFSSDAVQAKALELGAASFIEKGVFALELPAQLRSYC